jgi:hypothetical protein
VKSPQFARLWVQANTSVHQILVKALSGPGRRRDQREQRPGRPPPWPVHQPRQAGPDQARLHSRQRLPAINSTLSLFSAKYLVKAQTGYRLINDLKIVLPILTLLLLALGVYVARSHRGALIRAGLGLAASMLVLGAGLLIFRGVYLNGVPGTVLPADAAAALFDTLVRFIKEGLRTSLVVGLVIAAGAFLTEPSLTAVRIRGSFASGRRACGRANRPGRHLDLRPSRRAPRLGRGSCRAALRVLGTAHSGRCHCARRPAARRSRTDRTDRQQAAC